MRTRSRAALLAAARRIGRHGHFGLRLDRHAQGPDGLQGRQRGLPGAGLQEGHRQVPGGARAQARPVDAPTSTSATATTTCTSRPRRASRPTTPTCTKAVDYYKKATETITATRSSGSCRYEYLLAAYGTDKLNDPSQAEPIVQKMIEMDPDEPTNYFALAKIYEDAGNYERGGGDAAQGARRAGRRTRPSTCSWPASTTARGGSTRRSRP